MYVAWAAYLEPRRPSSLLGAPACTGTTAPQLKYALQASMAAISGAATLAAQLADRGYGRVLKQLAGRR